MDLPLHKKQFSAAVRPCPVCASTAEREVLYRQRFAAGPLGDGYAVSVCAACGAAFADGIPGQFELDAYYAERSKYTYAHADGAESPFDFKRFEAIADQLEPHLPSKAARILDIGCATGGLLAVLQRRGYTHVVGSDPSPACADAARRLHGIEVRTATLAEHAEWTERFDAVLLVGVLEHVREVRAAVGIAAGLLRPGGVLYGAQPDVEGFAACVNAPYQQFSTEHVNFFSTASLTRLLATAELAPVATWRWLVEWREGVTDSVVSGVFARSDAGVGAGAGAPAASACPRDVVSRGALVDYVAQSAAGEAATRQLIEELVRTQEPLLVWGAGTLTRHLLATTPLGRANLVAFVDSSPHLHGTELAGRRILAATELGGRPERILICSVVFAREISRMIRSELRLPNRVIMLTEVKNVAAGEGF